MRSGGYRISKEFRIDTACVTLFEVSEAINADAVDEALELHLAGSARNGCVEFKIQHAWPVKTPLPARKAKEGEAEAASSCSETDVSSAKSVTSDGTAPSVDTDMDSGIEDLNGDSLVEESDEPTGGSGDDDAPGAGSQEAPGDGGQTARAPAHKLWDCQWFFMSKPKSGTIVRMYMKAPLRQYRGDGMGDYYMSKTLRPNSFGEPDDSPVITMLVLRAWAIWRANYKGWASNRDGRMREVTALSVSLEKDIREHDGRAKIEKPVMQCKEAHRLLSQWVPEIVDRLLA